MSPSLASAALLQVLWKLVWLCLCAFSDKQTQIILFAGFTEDTLTLHGADVTFKVHFDSHRYQKCYWIRFMDTVNENKHKSVSSTSVQSIV